MVAVGGVVREGSAPSLLDPNLIAIRHPIRDHMKRISEHSNTWRVPLRHSDLATIPLDLMT